MLMSPGVRATFANKSAYDTLAPRHGSQSRHVLASSPGSLARFTGVFFSLEFLLYCLFVFCCCFKIKHSKTRVLGV